MISDLAPVDVLLQRIGRLHRHHGPARPADFSRPRCIVLAPDNFDAALATVKRDRISGPFGLGSVYENLPSLAATQRLIGDGADWTIPAMNRTLVEAATHPEALDGLVEELEAADPRWRDALQRVRGRGIAERNSCRAIALDWDQPVLEFRTDDHAATRLGARDVEVVLEPPRPGPFGRSASRLVIPQHLNPSGAFEPLDVVEISGGFEFWVSDSRFIYDSYGLRPHGG